MENLLLIIKFQIIVVLKTKNLKKNKPEEKIEEDNIREILRGKITIIILHLIDKKIL